MVCTFVRTSVSLRTASVFFPAASAAAAASSLPSSPAWCLAASASQEGLRTDGSGTA
jgi:hypothetical protein